MSEFPRPDCGPAAAPPSPADPGFIDLIPAAVYVRDAAAVVVRYNRRAAELWGRDPEPGSPAERFCGSHRLALPDGTPLRHADCPVGRALRTGWAVRNVEVVVERPDGTRRTVLASAEAYPGPDGQVAGAVAVLWDITDRKEAEDELQGDLSAHLRAGDELRASARRKDEWLAAVAHELKNPLAPLQNALAILNMTGAAGDVTDRTRALMGRQLAQMVRLVDDLLDLSRVAHGKAELRTRSIDLREVVGTAVEMSQPLADAVGHALTADLPAEPLALNADPVRLAQVFSNLLNNSVRYTPPGGSIRLAVERDGRQAVVRVRDTGVGIPADMLTRVFDLFTQAGGGRHQGGLGIGLSLVKSLVGLHGGSVEAHSDGPGRGSEFVVRLPIAGS